MNEEEIKTSESPAEEPVIEETPAVEPQTEAAAEAPTDKAESADIMQELTALGQKVVAAVQQIWDSEERKKAEAEIRDALRVAGQRIDQVSEEVQTSQVTEDLKGQAAKLKDAVEDSSITQEVRRGLLQGLRKLNDELSKLVDKGVARPAGAPAAPAEPAPAAAEEAGEAKSE